MEDNGQLPAFAALNESEAFIGLTKREYFAAMAMQGLISKDIYLDGGDIEEISKIAIDFADALLTQLNK